MEILTFPSVEEALAHMEKVREHNDRLIQPWHRQLAVGDHFVYHASDFFIYGQVLAREEDVIDAAGNEFSRQVPYTDRDSYRFCQCFSVACPEGEYGSVHLAHILTKLPPEAFALMKAFGWPKDTTTVRYVLAQGRNLS